MLCTAGRSFGCKAKFISKEQRMASFTNAADVITAAVEIERRGFAFYERAAAGSTQSEDKEFFLFMAGEEKRHEKIFEEMLQRAGGLELPAGSSEAEYLEYVDLVLDNHCMFLPEQQGEIRKDPLRQAMDFEKDTILFFTAMRRLVSPAEHPRIDACIEEEQRHLRLLAEYGKARAMALKG